MRQGILVCPLLVIMVAFATGCSNDARVSGKVSFDDGSPLTKGTVTFEDSSNSYIGEIKDDGTYVMSADGKKAGIPNGNYQVAILGAAERSDKDAPAPVGLESPVGLEGGRKIAVPLIDKKFTSPSTSGLTCDVKGKTVYDIKVTKP